MSGSTFIGEIHLQRSKQWLTDILSAQNVYEPESGGRGGVAGGGLCLERQSEELGGEEEPLPGPAVPESQRISVEAQCPFPPLVSPRGHSFAR